ncbi:MAG: Ig-like domain-containing protein [Woeseiaceae bacterium]|nr:Ig-like domain-containing protein [Woeseiaceae bacterium]
MKTPYLNMLLFLSVVVVVSLSGMAFADTDVTYEYDDLGRLIEVTADDGTLVEYDLDKVGNRENVTTTLPSANSPPNAVNDTASVAEFGSAYVYVLTNDSDPDNDTLTITSVTQSANASVSISGGGTRLLISGLFPGTFPATYTISDGNGGTDTATVSITVTGGGGWL